MSADRGARRVGGAVDVARVAESGGGEGRIARACQRGARQRRLNEPQIYPTGGPRPSSAPYLLGALPLIARIPSR